MSKGVHRLGDKTEGHGDAPPTTAEEASDDVFVNGKPVVRQGDPIVPHTHAGVYMGEGTVYVNGRPAQVVGSETSCGDKAAEGSEDVFIG